MSTNKKISVIMPAYNAEKYIERSIKSVLSQTYRNLELIVVDDGSTDLTPRILARLAKSDSRLRPIRTQNQGPAEARNHALQFVSEDADYITFIDSDDEFLPDAMAYALESADTGAELIIFGFSIVEEDGSTRDYCEPDVLIHPDDMKNWFATLYKANLLNQVWGKLYSASLIRESGVRFQDFLWGEDRLFVFDVLEHASVVAVKSECKYRYVMHPGESLISRFYGKKFTVCCDVDMRAQDLCNRFGIKDDADFRYMFAKSVFSCITTLFSDSCNYSEDGKLAYVREIMENPRVQQRCKHTSGGVPANYLCSVLHSNNPRYALSVFRTVAKVGEKAPQLFLALKHRK